MANKSRKAKGAAARTKRSAGSQQRRVMRHRKAKLFSQQQMMAWAPMFVSRNGFGAATAARHDCTLTLIKHQERMFKDDFIAVARAHHLSLSTERAYWDCARRHIKRLGAKSPSDIQKDPTNQFREHLTALANGGLVRIDGDEGVSASTQNLFFHALKFFYEKVVEVKLGDLSGIPRAKGHSRIVDVPDIPTATRIVEAVPGKSGDVLRVMYEQCRRLQDVLKDPSFKGLHNVTVQRNLASTIKKLKFKRHYTVASIHHASARRIAQHKGFLAAHKAIGAKNITSTERILGKKILDNLAR